MDDDVDEPQYRLRPYTTIQVWRKLRTPMLMGGVKIARYKAPFITEYVDMVTGEIIAVDALKDHPDFGENLELPPTFHFSEAVLQREFILASLRKEVREFALFVRVFRNQRRGITPGIDTLVRWYAKLTEKQPCHVERYVKRLEDAGILAGSSLLGSLFQIAGKSVPPRAHLGEESKATATYMVMLIKKQSENRIDTSPCETPRPCFKREPTACTSTSKTTVLEFLQSLISAGKLRPQFS